MIDTNAKKMSLLSFGKPGFTLPAGPTPFTVPDKRHFLGLYIDVLVVIVESKGVKGISSDAVLSATRITILSRSGDENMGVSRNGILSVL